jgi:hypothetical protein
MDLPDEIALRIFGFLPCVVVRFSAGAVSRQWRRVAADATLGTCLTEFNGTPSGVCDCAAEMGHLTCLVYARTMGCPWSKDTLSMPPKVDASIVWSMHTWPVRRVMTRKCVGRPLDVGTSRAWCTLATS